MEGGRNTPFGCFPLFVCSRILYTTRQSRWWQHWRKTCYVRNEADSASGKDSNMKLIMLFAIVAIAAIALVSMRRKSENSSS